MHTDVIYDADLQMSRVNNCVKFINRSKTFYIIPIVFISYFLANKILRGIICTRIIKHNIIDYFMKEEDKTIFFITQFGPKI